MPITFSSISANFTQPAPLAQRATPLRLVYTNDTHEKYNAMANMVTGFGYFDAVGRQQGKDVMNFSAGDWNIGSEANELQLNVQLQNMLNLQAGALGNHELDGGGEKLGQALRQANFPTIATNFYFPPNGVLYQDWLAGKLVTGPKIVTTEHGERYGLVGLAVPNAAQYLSPDAPMAGTGTLNLTQSVQRLQGDIDQLEKAGINKIILVSHSGYPEDLNQIAKGTHGLDIIVGGHSHTTLNGIQPNINYVLSQSGEPVMIVQTGQNAKALGVLDTNWDANGHVVPLQNTLYNPMQFPKNPAAAALMDRFLGQPTLLAWMATDSSTENAVSGGENAVADSIADAMRQATGANMAFIRGTELRNDIRQGVFTSRDLRTMLPFSDNLVTVAMTGYQILDALNESARCLKLHENHPGCLQPSGLRYTVDLQSGQTISAHVLNPLLGRWEPLNPLGQYTVCVGEFITKNKREYPVFKATPILQKFPFNPREAFAQSLLARQGQPVSFAIDGRLTMVNATPAMNTVSGLLWPASQPPNPIVSAFQPWNATSAVPGYFTSPMFSKNRSPFITHTPV